MGLELKPKTIIDGVHSPRVVATDVTTMPAKAVRSAGHPSSGIIGNLYKGMTASSSANNSGFQVQREQTLETMEKIDAAFQRTSKATLVSSHPIYQELNTLISETAAELGLGKEPGFSITVVDDIWQNESNQEQVKIAIPSAFIYPRTREIFVSTKLLKILDYRQDLIRAIIAHELAHAFAKQRQGEQLDHSDLLSRKLSSFQEEYYADRCAAIVSSSFGENPRAIGIALDKIETYCQKIYKKNSKDQDLFNPLFSTHPHSNRRITANQKLSRNLVAPREKNQDSLILSSIEKQDLSADYLQDSPDDPLHLAPEFYPIDKFIERSLDDYLAACKQENFDDDCLNDIEALALAEIFDASFDGDKTQAINQWFKLTFAVISDPSKEGLKYIFEELDQINDLKQMETVLENFACKNSNTIYLTDGTNNDLAEILINKYLGFLYKQKQTELDVLGSSIQLFTRNEINYGMNFDYRQSKQVPALFSRCLKDLKGNENKLIEIINTNPSFFIDLIKKNIYLDNPIQELINFAQKNNIYFALNLVQLDKSDFEQEINSRSPIRKITLNQLPEFTINLEKTVNVNSCKIDSRGNSRIVNISFTDEQNLKSSLDQVLKELPKEVLDIFSRDDFGRSSQHKIEQIKDSIPKEAKSIVLVDDTRDFLQNRVAKLDKSNLTQKVSELRKASLESSRDKLLGLSVEDYIIIHGQEEFEREFLFVGRNNFTARTYAEFEQSNYTLTQLWHMWNQVFAAEFDAKPQGIGKLDFLLSTFTTKTFSRDQKIVEAIGYPELNSWQDIVKVKEQISQESNIGLLFKLRDMLMNPILVNHLQRVIDKNVSNDLLNKLEDTAEIAAINSLDPSLLRDNPKLKKILLVYNTKSPFRDALIKPFIDAQNSQTLKLALSSLSTEPSQIDINNDKTGLQALESETILDVLTQFTETDKAEVLLYFLGKRSFDTRLLKPDQEITSINDFTNPDIFSQATIDSQDDLQMKNVLWRRHFPKELFCMPDALVRLLKMVGMDAQTMQDTMDSVSSDREQIEALDEILNGSNGVLNKEKVKNYFFKNAASTIVNSAKIQFSSSINKETLARFLEFALSNCPREKLAVLFKNMWALTKTQNLTIEKLTAQLLQSLGPAFIKFGQKLATMDLPESFKQELRKLSSQNTIADTSFFYHHLNSALKTSNRFDPNHSGEKIGEGSMAATYQAELAASNPLDMSSDQSHLQRAVKIIHPFIRDDIEMDIEFIRKLIAFINDNSSDFGGLKIPANTADVIKARLMVQSDPQEEILRATLLKSNLSKSLLDVSFEAIEIDHENSAGLVIASKFKPGLELDKITDPEISKQSRNAVGLEILRQILQGDAYQSDPNLGNFGYIADKKKPKVFWYDSGSVEKIEKEDQKTLLKLIKAIATKKQDDISTLLLSLLKNSPEAFKSSIQSWIKTIKPNEKDAFANVKNIFESFVDLVARNNLELEDKWVSLADTLGYLRPLMEGIDPKLVTGLVKDSLKRAKLLTTAEQIAIYFNGVGS